MQGLYRDEDREVPVGSWPAEADQELFLVQQDESVPLPNWPEGEPRPKVPERNRARRGAAGRRRNRQLFVQGLIQLWLLS